MKKLLLLGLILFSVNASAQQIKDHPQKNSYASSAEYPVGSTQGHWMRQNRMSHVHIDLKCPIYGIFHPGDTVQCEFTIILFNDGIRVTDVSFGAYKEPITQNVTYTQTGTSQRPIMVGDTIGGVKTWTGQFSYVVPQHEKLWWFIWGQVFVEFDDGTSGHLQRIVPVWIENPNYNEDDTISYSIPFLASRWTVVSQNHPEVIYGENAIDVFDIVPIAPFTSWPSIKAAMYSYGGQNLTSIVSEARVDLDLHNNIPGETLWSVNQIEDLNSPPLNFDRSGTHKYAIMRSVTVNDEMLSVLMVFNETLSNNTPLCQDPLANNVGQPLPCTYNPPPVNWHSGNVFWKEGMPMIFELCPTNDPLDLACQVQ